CYLSAGEPAGRFPPPADTVTPRVRALFPVTHKNFLRPAAPGLPGVRSGVERRSPWETSEGGGPLGGPTDPGRQSLRLVLLRTRWCRHEDTHLPAAVILGSHAGSRRMTRALAPTEVAESFQQRTVRALP